MGYILHNLNWLLHCYNGRCDILDHSSLKHLKEMREKYQKELISMFFKYFLTPAFLILIGSLKIMPIEHCFDS